MGELVGPEDASYGSAAGAGAGVDAVATSEGLGDVAVGGTSDEVGGCDVADGDAGTAAELGVADATAGGAPVGVQCEPCEDVSALVYPADE